MNKAAFFDMDGTLVSVHTGRLYLRWRFARREMSLKDLMRASWWLMGYTFGLIDITAVTTHVMQTLRGQDEAEFRSQCREWFENNVRSYISAAARDAVLDYQSQDYVCAILSGSTPYVVDPLAKELHIKHVLCTRPTVVEGRFTGDYHSPVCYGDGKLAIAEAWAQDQGVDLSQSLFFSDSISDVPMLERVGQPRVVNPDPRLHLLAKRRQWPIERWK